MQSSVVVVFSPLLFHVAQIIFISLIEIHQVIPSMCED